MSLTSQIGTKDARLGNIELGEGIPATTFFGTISENLTFTEAWVGRNLTQFASDTVIFSEVMHGYAVRGEGVDTITFSETLFRNIVSGQSITDTLTFTEHAVHTIFASITDDLTFTDEMDGLRYTVGISADTLTLNETLARQLLAVRVINEGLPFTELLTKNANRLRPITESLTLTDVMLGLNVKPAYDTITFSETLTEFIAKLVRDFIDWDSIFSVNGVFNRSTGDVFEMYDSIFLNTYMRLPIVDSILFTEVMNGQVIRVAADTLTFTETTTAIASKIAVDSLTFTDVLKVNKVQQVTSADTMLFTDTTNVNIVVTEVLSDSLILSDNLQMVRWRFGVATDSMSFTDKVVREIREAVISTDLTFSDTLAYHKIGNRTILDTVTFTDSARVSIVYTRSLVDSLVFLEAPPADILPPAAISIPAGGSTTVGAYGVVAGKMMTFIGQTRSVVIKAPEFNDFITERVQTVFKRKMTGVVSTFIKTSPEQKLHYEFLVPKPKADEFRAFLDAENGNAFTIYDWNGYVWIAKLLTDNIDKTEVGRWDPCGNKTHITVEFIGRRYA